jgi:hypothetical protein
LACAKTELDLIFSGRQIIFRIKSAQLVKNIKKPYKIMSKQTLTKAVLMGSIRLGGHMHMKSLQKIIENSQFPTKFYQRIIFKTRDFGGGSRTRALPRLTRAHKVSNQHLINIPTY